MRALLADYLGQPAKAPDLAPQVTLQPAAPVVSTTLAGLSPWLGARLARSVEPGLGLSGRRRENRADAREPFMTFAMTPTALAALQSAARELRPTEAPAAAPSPARAGWRARLAQLGGLRR